MVKIALKIAVRIFLIFQMTGLTLAINCWHCIAKDCDMDPNDNFKAIEKQCLDGQYCQKVFFSMYSTMDNKVYISTVRGCAWDCQPQNDFKNCSSDLHGSRGCVNRNCCRDADLCNATSRVHISNTIFIMFVIHIFLYIQDFCYINN